MTMRRRLSAVLLDTGRITQEEIDRALEHQRTHGGYFGEAAVELGMLSREEIDWALANQLDLPFVFPDPSAADPNATQLVPPDWALAHLAVPLVRAGSTLTVVVADPLDQASVDELRERTGLEVEMALATASRIRELIRAVYPPPEPPSVDARPPVKLEDFVTEALAQGADRIGLSARGMDAVAWYAVGGSRERRALEEGWRDQVDALCEEAGIGGGEAHGGGSVRRFEATLRRMGEAVTVDAQLMSSLSGLELLMRPRRSPGGRVEGALPAALRAELRLLAGTGRARVGVCTAPASPSAPPSGAHSVDSGSADGAARSVAGGASSVEAADVLPSLPALVLGEAARSVHVTLEEDVPGVYTLRVEEGMDVAAVVDAYDFDAVTIDLPLDDPRLAATLAAAPLGFARLPTDAEPAALDRAGIDWILTVSGDRRAPAWELHPRTR